jgi:hypothetical protein
MPARRGDYYTENLEFVAFPPGPPFALGNTVLLSRKG